MEKNYLKEIRKTLGNIKFDFSWVFHNGLIEEISYRKDFRKMLRILYKPIYVTIVQFKRLND